jgi:hypothetical protein
MSAQYSIGVTPTAALLGEPIIAELRCVVRSDVRETLTFGHRSLVVELDREGLAEPALAFPNRYAVERGGQLLRISSAGGIEDLTAGEERTRTIDLAPLFPELVLSVGRFAVTYRLEEADPVVRPAPVAVEVASGPGAISHLIGCLAAGSSDLRSRAADLLAVMTAQDFGYEAGAAGESQAAAIRRWQIWWQNVGSALPWNFESDGATFGVVAPRAPSGRSYRLGGVAYPGANG